MFFDVRDDTISNIFSVLFRIKRIVDVLCISSFTQICLQKYKLDVGNPPKKINQIGQFDFMG